MIDNHFNEIQKRHIADVYDGAIKNNLKSSNKRISLLYSRYEGSSVKSRRNFQLTENDTLLVEFPSSILSI